MSILVSMDATDNNNSSKNTVTLPCGDVGTAGPAINGERKVVHHDRTLGAGPWIYPATSLTPATSEQAAAYHARCEAFRAARQVGFLNPETGYYAA